MLHNWFQMGKRREWQDLNEFEKRMWRNQFKMELKELHRRRGYKLEHYVIATHIADKKLKVKSRTKRKKSLIL